MKVSTAVPSYGHTYPGSQISRSLLLLPKNYRLKLGTVLLTISLGGVGGNTQFEIKRKK